MGDVMERENLLANLRETGEFLRTKLEEMDGVANVRGKGTFIAFDLESTAQRNALIARLRKNGVHIGGCGQCSVRLRPALIFEVKHAHIFIERLAQSLKELDA